ncbi:MAG: methyltransferase domain-containing protein [Planctomycetota bacterium]
MPASTTVSAPVTLTSASSSGAAVSPARKDAPVSARQKKKDKKKKKDKLKPGGLTAATSDRHILYEKSVQEPEAECDLVEKVWREQHTRECRVIREDFSGTSQVCMEWVKRDSGNRAIGVDLDRDVLDWARERLTERLNDDQRGRVSLIEGDVLATETERVDSVLAMNFSYYLFRTRDELRDYFRAVLGTLKDDGLFLLDAYGGSDAFSEIEEPRELDGFTYIWEQASYNPIDGSATNYIHFEFPDGTRIDRAFEYIWRLWTLPEIRELLAEAGFSNVAVYWEGTDEDTDEGNGEFDETEVGEACEGWVAYLVARP